MNSRANTPQSPVRLPGAVLRNVFQAEIGRHEVIGGVLGDEVIDPAGFFQIGVRALGQGVGQLPEIGGEENVGSLLSQPALGVLRQLGCAGAVSGRVRSW